MSSRAAGASLGRWGGAAPARPFPTGAWCALHADRVRRDSAFVWRDTVPAAGPCADLHDATRCTGCHAAAPEAVALALIEHRRRLVLIRRTKAPLAGYWAPPAGHIERGESAAQAVIREAREESGLRIALDGMLGVYTERQRPERDSRMVITAFRSHSVAGEPVAGDDAGDIRLFRPGDLPVQAPPQRGTPTDYWVYGVIQRLTAAWRFKQTMA